jgi:hypothetical protein
MKVIFMCLLFVCALVLALGAFAEDPGSRKDGMRPKRGNMTYPSITVHGREQNKLSSYVPNFEALGYNLLLSTDAYKATHWKMFDGLQYMYGGIEPRMVKEKN